jgi:hypothetical protein
MLASFQQWRKYGGKIVFRFARNVLYTQHRINEGIITPLLEHSIEENIHFGVSSYRLWYKFSVLRVAYSLRLIESGEIVCNSSSLKSIIEDQVRFLNSQGIAAVFTGQSETDETIAKGEYTIVFQDS